MDFNCHLSNNFGYIDPFHYGIDDQTAKSSTNLVTGQVTTMAKQPAASTTRPEFATMDVTSFLSGYETRFHNDPILSPGMALMFKQSIFK